MAGPKSQLDWEAIERDYRSGAFTNRELGAKHGCSHTLIQRKAKDQNWQKDLTGAVKAATQARLIEAEVSKVASAEIAKRVSKTVSNAIPATTEVVAAVAEVNSAVILRHRADIGTLRQLAMDMAGELMLVTHSQGEIIRLQEVLNGSADPDEADAARRSVDDLLKLHNRVGSAQKLADTLTKLQVLERKAFSLDDEDGKGQGGAGAGRELSDVERATRLARLLDVARSRKPAEDGQA